MSITVRYLVLALRRPDFDEAAVAPHLAFLDDLRAALRLAGDVRTATLQAAAEAAGRALPSPSGRQ